MNASRQFVLRARGPYSLAASTSFLEGFAPAGQPAAGSDHTHWAFAADDGTSVVGACLRPRRDGASVEVFGGDGPAIRAQVARVLSLDADAESFPDVGRRDPVVGRLQARYPGLRPVLFFTPYEAAAWAVICHRIQIRQAARIKERLTHELGFGLEIHGERRLAFPPPERVQAADHLPGLPDRKAANLRAVAGVAASGGLDADHLRSLQPEEALAELKTLPGIGDFFAELILVRGVGTLDFLPMAGPRLLRAVALAYEIDVPTPDELVAIADSWRPYRTWVAFLLRVLLEDTTHEIGGRTRRGVDDRSRPRGR